MNNQPSFTIPTPIGAIILLIIVGLCFGQEAIGFISLIAIAVAVGIVVTKEVKKP